MKKAIIFFSVCITWVACYTNNQNESAIINELFLQMVDTIYYQYHTLRPAPNNKIYNIRNNDSFFIKVNTTLQPLDSWKNNIEVILKNRLNNSIKNEDYLELIRSFKNQEAGMSFPIAAIKNTGRYRLVEYTNTATKENIFYIGSLTFSRVLVSQDKHIAMLVVIIKDNIKNGIEKLFILKQTEGKWKIYAEEVLEIW